MAPSPLEAAVGRVPIECTNGEPLGAACTEASSSRPQNDCVTFRRLAQRVSHQLPRLDDQQSDPCASADTVGLPGHGTVDTTCTHEKKVMKASDLLGSSLLQLRAPKGSFPDESGHIHSPSMSSGRKEQYKSDVPCSVTNTGNESLLNALKHTLRSQHARRVAYSQRAAFQSAETKAR